MYDFVNSQLVCAFGLYIWCAAADPADSGVFKSKKYIKNLNNKKHVKPSESKLGGESNPSVVGAAAIGEEANDKGKIDAESAADRNSQPEKKNSSPQKSTFSMSKIALLPCACFCNSHEESEDHQSEDGMFYCSLCEVEVIRCTLI